LKFGYARVSKNEQSLDVQIQKLTAAGCDEIFQEKISGAKDERPQLNALLGKLRKGDSLCVVRLDRLGRRIQISDLCSFWDLHVAIQDAMGWTDSHLHDFEMNHSIEKGKQHMGIPDDDGFDDVYHTLPGWDYRVRDYLIINDQFIYSYDFGDGWKHRIEYEGLHEKQPDAKGFVAKDFTSDGRIYFGQTYAASPWNCSKIVMLFD